MGLVPARLLKHGLRIALMTGACVSAAACADLPKTGFAAPAIDTASPVARQVELASRDPGPYPELSRIPQTPTDVRPTRAWSRSIYDMLRLRRQMMVQEAMLPPLANDTEAFAQQERAAAAPPKAAASRPDFVKSARERATPPSSAR